MPVSSAGASCPRQSPSAAPRGTGSRERGSHCEAGIGRLSHAGVRPALRAPRPPPGQDSEEEEEEGTRQSAAAAGDGGGGGQRGSLGGAPVPRSPAHKLARPLCLGFRPSWPRHGLGSRNTKRGVKSRGARTVHSQRARVLDTPRHARVSRTVGRRRRGRRAHSKRLGAEVSCERRRGLSKQPPLHSAAVLRGTAAASVAEGRPGHSTTARTGLAAGVARRSRDGVHQAGCFGVAADGPRVGSRPGTYRRWRRRRCACAGVSRSARWCQPAGHDGAGAVAGWHQPRPERAQPQRPHEDRSSWYRPEPLHA